MFQVVENRLSQYQVVENMKIACHVPYQDFAEINQEIADVLAWLHRGDQTKQICQSKIDHGDMRKP